MRRLALALLAAVFTLIPAAHVAAMVPAVGGFTITTTVTGNGAAAAAGTRFFVHYAIDGRPPVIVQPRMQDGDTFTLADLPIGTEVYVTAELPSSAADLYWESVSVNGAPSVTFTIEDAGPVDVQIDFTALLTIGQVQLDALTDGIDRAMLPAGAAFTFDWTAGNQSGSAEVSAATGWSWLSPEFPIGTDVVIREALDDRTAADLPAGWEWVGDPAFSPGSSAASVLIGFGTSLVTATNRALGIVPVSPPVVEEPALPVTGRSGGPLLAVGIGGLLLGLLVLLLDRRRQPNPVP